MEIGENIYKLRTKQGLSQGDLADALEVSRQSVSKWENNSAVPELEKLVKMAKVFGVSLDTLVGNEQTPPEQPVMQTRTVEKETVVVSPSFPTQKILGIALICLGISGFLLGWALEVNLSELGAGLMVFGGICMALCGLFCLYTKYPGLYCGWAVWGLVSMLVFVCTPRWEDNGISISFVLLLLAAMLIWTVWAQVTKRTQIPIGILVMGAMFLLFLGLMLLINLIPPVTQYVTPPVPVSPAG